MERQSISGMLVKKWRRPQKCIQTETRTVAFKRCLGGQAFKWSLEASGASVGGLKCIGANGTYGRVRYDVATSVEQPLENKL